MKVNKKGCSPDGDVCMAHERPLICRHGCEEAIPHRCGGFGTLNEPDDSVIAIRGGGPTRPPTGHTGRS